MVKSNEIAGPYDIILKEKAKAITLEANEYVRLVDDVTGRNSFGNW